MRKGIRPLTLSLSLASLSLFYSCSDNKQPPPLTGPQTGQLGGVQGGLQPLPGTDPNFDPSLDPNFDPNFDPNNGGFVDDPGFVDGPVEGPGFVDSPVEGPGFVDPNADPNALPPEDPTFNPTDTGVVGDDIPGGIAPTDPTISDDNPYVADPSDDLIGGGIPDLGGDILGSAPPEADPAKGNTELGFVKIPKVVSLSGLAVSGGQVFVGHYDDGFIRNNRYIRGFNLADGTINDVSVYSQFRDGDNPTRLISGVGAANGEIWATLNEPDDDGFNVFRYSTSGDKVKTYSVGSTGLGDIAIGGGKAFVVSPSDQGVVSLDIQSSQASIINTGNPGGIGTDSAGNLYVSVNGEVVKYNGSDGTEALRFDGTGKNGTGKVISRSGDIGVDPNNGDIYVVSGSGPGTVIARYTATGDYVHSFGSSNLTDPGALAVGSNGHIYLSDKQLGATLAFGEGK